MKQLAARLSKFKSEVDDLSENATIQLQKDIIRNFEQMIDQLVYSVYTIGDYERTFHIRGEHGALKKWLTHSSRKNKFEFYIDEESRDPVDGETWGTKADNLEHGSTNMYGKLNPMPDRPFIDQIQNTLVDIQQRTADELIKNIEKSLKKLL